MVEKYKFCILNKVKRDKELKNEKNNFSNWFSDFFSFVFG